MDYKDYIKYCNGEERIPLEIRTNRDKCKFFLDYITEKNIQILNKDIYTLASWIKYSIGTFNKFESFSQVRSIEYGGEMQTYDLHVTDGNSYTANGIICHNTVNLPEDVTTEEVSDIYKEAWKSGCKGLTIYRKNCRSGVLVDKDCNCRPNKICKSNAPKRPESLPCDIYHIKVKEEAYFVIIGLFNGKEPYEVFAGKNKNMKTEIKKGLIKKVKRGKYALCDENEECQMIYDDVNKFINEEQEAITRMISSNLRHGTPLEFLVHQLEKIEGDMQGFSKAISRVLKKYIKDGTKVTGEVCSKCGGDLVRNDGCSLCQSCGYSKCS